MSKKTGWKARAHTGFVRDENGKAVCFAYGANGSSKADKTMNDRATLFSAAPELLAALREVEEFLDDRADADQPAGCDHPIPNDEMRLLVTVRAALDKTEGRL